MAAGGLPPRGIGGVRVRSHVSERLHTPDRAAEVIVTRTDGGTITAAGPDGVLATSDTDVAAVLQAVLDADVRNDIHVGPGIYPWDSTLDVDALNADVDQGFTLSGSGWWNTEFECSDTVSPDTDDTGHASMMHFGLTGRVFGVTMRDFAIAGSNDNNPNTFSAFNFRDARNVVADNIYVRDMTGHTARWKPIRSNLVDYHFSRVVAEACDDTGFHLEALNSGSYNLRRIQMEQTYSFDNVVGIEFVGTRVNDCELTDFTLQANDDEGAILRGCENVSFQNCTIARNNDSGGVDRNVLFDTEPGGQAPGKNVLHAKWNIGRRPKQVSEHVDFQAGTQNMVLGQRVDARGDVRRNVVNGRVVFDRPPWDDPYWDGEEFKTYAYNNSLTYWDETTAPRDVPYMAVPNEGTPEWRALAPIGPTDLGSVSGNYDGQQAIADGTAATTALTQWAWDATNTQWVRADGGATITPA